METSEDISSCQPCADALIKTKRTVKYEGTENIYTHAELDEKHYPASPSLDVILSAVYIFCNSMFDLKYSRQYWGPLGEGDKGWHFFQKRGTVAN